MIKEKLSGKRVLVTAGAQGIGESISRRFIGLGAHVAVHYFASREQADRLTAAPTSPNQILVAIGGDLTDAVTAGNVVKHSATALGGLDILINNTGSLVARRSLAEIDDAFWREVMDLNMSSMVAVTQAAAPLLAQAPAGSSIVNLSSLAGRKGGHAGSLAYATAKGAVLTWTRALAQELAGQGTRVNAVTPGLILGTSFHNTHTTPEAAEKTIAGIPLHTAGTPDDVARAVVYLASEYDGFITGATLDINGGVYFA